MVRLGLLRMLIGAVTICPPLAAQQTTPAFEVVSIRPNITTDGIPSSPAPPDGISLVNRPVDSVVRFAYDMPFFRIVGMPAWRKRRASTSLPKPHARSPMRSVA